MGTVSARLPDDIEESLDRYVEAERVDRSTAVRKLLAEGLEAWRQERALDRLQEGQVTLARAAEEADLSTWEFARLVRDRDITWVDAEGVRADLEDL